MRLNDLAAFNICRVRIYLFTANDGFVCSIISAKSTYKYELPNNIHPFIPIAIFGAAFIISFASLIIASFGASFIISFTSLIIVSFGASFIVSFASLIIVSFGAFFIISFASLISVSFGASFIISFASLIIVSFGAPVVIFSNQFPTLNDIPIYNIICYICISFFEIL